MKPETFSPRSHTQNHGRKTRVGTAIRNIAASCRVCGFSELPTHELTRNSQEPDPATKSRAVPIYATTVGGFQKTSKSDADVIHRVTHSMIQPMERDSLVSKNSATSTVGS